MDPKQNSKPQFVEMYEVAELSPIWVDNENGNGIQNGLPSLGFYADKYFLYFHKTGMGKAYYEQSEMLNSARQAFEYLSVPRNLSKFEKQVEHVLRDIEKFVFQMAVTELDNLSLIELKSYSQQQIDLDYRIFSLFDATQPQNFSLFEKEIRLKLEEVADSKQSVDEILGILTSSDKPNKVSQEELEWLKIIKLAKEHGEFINSKDLVIANPHIDGLIHKHFEKYKVLTLGDGHWEPNVEHFYNNFESDQNRDLSAINKRIDELTSLPAVTRKIKKSLIDKYKLSEEIVHYTNIIAEIGHLRLTMRAEGFISLAAAKGPILAAAKKLGMDTSEICYCTVEEFYDLLLHPDARKIEMLKQRKQEETYLMAILDGKRCFYYGKEAEVKYAELVEHEDISDVSEVRGNTAMVGKVEGEAFVFSWGDDLAAAVKTISKKTILVAGQTRPQLMPLIRACVGIVTDEGGVTSHAAIVARELKMPCVVGTKVATKVIQTGDKIELDADDGIVKILKRS